MHTLFFVITGVCPRSSGNTWCRIKTDSLLLMILSGSKIVVCSISARPCYIKHDEYNKVYECQLFYRKRVCHMNYKYGYNHGEYHWDEYNSVEKAKDECQRAEKFCAYCKYERKFAAHTYRIRECRCKRLIVV